MKPYIVYAPPFHQGSAGIVVMHRLMQELRRAGASVYTMQEQQNPDLMERDKVPFLPCSILKSPVNRDAIAIYPEIVHGNPLHCDKVVRYILCTPGFWGGPATFPEDDMLVVYSDYWNKQSGLNLPDEKVLFIPDLIESEWPNMGKERKYNMVYRGKGTQPEVPINPPPIKLEQGQFLDGKEKQDDLRRKLSECHYFFCYDVASAIMPIALMSGCRLVLVSDPNKEPALPITMTEETVRKYYRDAEEALPGKIKRFIDMTQGEEK